MPFPESKRIIYEKSPLKEVICQIRFPKILKINANDPVEFQDKIRIEFPIYEKMIERSQEFQINAQNDGIHSIQPIANEAISNHKFSTADNNWRINLTSTFISLSTTNYTQWEEFRGKLDMVLRELKEEYTPAFFDRVGLRYIDVFDKKYLGLGDCKWDELIQPYALGFIGEKHIGDQVKSHNINSEIQLVNTEGVMRIVAGLGNVKGVEEKCFILDSDVYCSERSILDVIPKLDKLHKKSSNLLRWLITDKMHEAMIPSEVIDNE